jgi:2-keto-4-pentenoate hydratase/2-oxohepta-3-ene-1,7-dioic acid hydratase in catechol pathway
MKFMRFEYQGKASYGVLEPGDFVRVYDGDIFDDAWPTGEMLPLSNVRLLPPCVPSKLVALWNNSRIQIESLKRDTPKEALWFLKPPSCFATHADPIIYPAGHTERVVLEGELGIVIGRHCKAVSVEEARYYIFGYTVINDVTAQDVVKRDATFPQYDRGKGYDSFGVFGPVIECALDPMKLVMRSYVNGELKQEFPVTDYVFSPYQVVAEISKTATLYPGDVICCGTSLNAAPIVPGDTVEIRIEGIGSLVNPVIAERRDEHSRRRFMQLTHITGVSHELENA